jgi:hypothetical protein
MKLIFKATLPHLAFPKEGHLRLKLLDLLDHG